MIFRVPSGQFKDQLPRDGASGSVTFTISNELPIVTDSQIIQIPRSLEIRDNSSKIFDKQARKQFNGERLFTLSSGRSSVSRSGSLLFEVGQIIDEFDISETQVTSTNIPDVLDIQHDTNLLDLASAGLDETEIQEINDSASILYEEYLEEYNSIQTSISNLNGQLSTNQKMINETNKALNAISLIFNGSSDDTVEMKLKDRLSTLESEKESFITSLNSKNEDASEIYAKILKIKELIR